MKRYLHRMLYFRKSKWKSPRVLSVTAWLSYNFRITSSWLLHHLTLWRKLKMILFATQKRQIKQNKKSLPERWFWKFPVETGNRYHEMYLCVSCLVDLFFDCLICCTSFWQSSHFPRGLCCIIAKKTTGVSLLSHFLETYKRTQFKPTIPRISSIRITRWQCIFS